MGRLIDAAKGASEGPCPGDEAARHRGPTNKETRIIAELVARGAAPCADREARVPPVPKLQRSVRVGACIAGTAKRVGEFCSSGATRTQRSESELPATSNFLHLWGR